MSSPSSNSNVHAMAAPAAAKCAYANICRVTSTAEELLLEFGLTSQPSAPADERLPVQQRVVMQWETAKRLAQLLGTAIERHEQLFGHLETDVSRRVVPGLHPPQSDDDLFG